MFRKTVFWAHLISGICVGLVVFMMSFTGVLITYERQIESLFAHADYLSTEQQGPSSKSINELIEISQYRNPDFLPNTVVFTNHSGAPVTLRQGRAGRMQLNPYSGDEMLIGSAGLENFFRAVTGWHRWFNVTGESRATARAITGASNLVFLFLIFSGIYLWLPSTWRWVMFKVRLTLDTNPPNSQARDFNWHHVFGIWCAIPLIFIVATAAVFNYSWANNLVYQIYGEEAPQRGRTSTNQPTRENSALARQNYLSLDELFQSAQQLTEQTLGHWQTISITLPSMNADQVEFEINQSLGGQPQKQFTLALNRTSGEQLNLTGLSDASPGQQTRRIIRFLHTGEVLGFWGQTIAGLVSFATLLMIWSGFALAYRRLIKPLFRKT
ncbi:MAG: hypothetical protein COA71_08655 [SAR86 cluster bacterium]|uniref:Peptidase n=1 Tax=SAR86 cluster bacterium TaxID=2030880 RepID=A0A2A5CBA3_9GAMM|nr:PepSY domain-containing protein [Gammaproteobacteria bacterium AH-315-E17]PCJ41107.1 MAG: hypothetical protein COA71_08655 [SAR86 cluster bacterium]